MQDPSREAYCNICFEPKRNVAPKILQHVFHK